MPPYYSMAFGFRRRDVRPGFVAEVYDAFFAAGLAFDRVEDGAPDQSLASCIRWNQELLEQGFELGFTDDASLGYRQLYLSHPPFSHPRIFVMASTQQVVLVIPEHEVFEDGEEDLMDQTVDGLALARLERVASEIWASGLFAAIQTSGENGYAPPVVHLERGAPLSAVPFAILDAACLRGQRVDAVLNPGRFEIEEIPGSGTWLRAPRARR